MNQQTDDIYWYEKKIPENVSLRDYFAAKALQGLLAWGGDSSWEDDAKNAYQAADAMLKAREAKL